MKMRRILILIATVVALAAVPFVAAFASSSTTYVVTPTSLQGWQTSGDSGTTITFVDGPATPPLGSGSLELRIPANGDLFANLRQPGYAGTRLESLTALSYSTYVQRNIFGQAPYLILNIDTDGNGSVDDLLFFEPVY